jgi:DNA-binding transcriptional MerR regulator
MMSGHSIGEVSRLARVKVPTIRYYEQIGLMPAPLRSEGKQRRYGSTEIARLNFIRHARELGFGIDAIRELLALSGEPDRPCASADQIAQRHLNDVDRRIARLKALRTELQRMLTECRHGEVCECRVIQVLADHARCQHEHGDVHAAKHQRGCTVEP